MLRQSLTRWNAMCLVLLGTLRCLGAGTVSEIPIPGDPPAATFDPRIVPTGEVESDDAGSPQPPDAGPRRVPDGGAQDAGALDVPDGGCIKPTALNTGIPAGTTLTVHNGDLTLRTDGEVVTGKEIKGSVMIAANNVTLRNSRVHGGIDVASGKTAAVIDHCNIGPDTGTFLAANPPALVQNHDFKLLHSDLHNFVSAVGIGSNVYLYGNYLHDYYVGGNRSAEAAGGWGVSGPGEIRFECNNIDMADPAPGTSHEVNSIIELICVDTSKPLQSLVLNNNWFSGGGVGVYVWGPWTTLQITNNVWDGTANYGEISHNKDTPLIWSGNTFTDGGVLKNPGVNSPGTNCHQ